MTEVLGSDQIAPAQGERYRPQRLPPTTHDIPAESPPAQHDSRRQLIAAIAEVCAEGDYADVTIADLATRAAVSTATLYGHFDSRGDCLLASYEMAPHLLKLLLWPYVGSKEATRLAGESGETSGASHRQLGAHPSGGRTTRKGKGLARFPRPAPPRPPAFFPLRGLQVFIASQAPSSFILKTST